MADNAHKATTEELVRHLEVRKKLDALKLARAAQRSDEAVGGAAAGAGDAAVGGGAAAPGRLAPRIGGMGRAAFIESIKRNNADLAAKGVHNEELGKYLSDQGLLLNLQEHVPIVIPPAITVPSASTAPPSSAPTVPASARARILERARQMAEAKARNKLLDPSSTTKPENISRNDSGNNTQNLSGNTTQNQSGNTAQNQGNTTLNVSENSLVVTASTHNLSGLSESKTKNLTDEGIVSGSFGTSTHAGTDGTAGTAGTGELVDRDKFSLLPTYPPKKRGEKGREFNASANIVRLTVKQDMGVYEYSVQFNPPMDNIREKKRHIRRFTDTIGATYKFDGATLWLPILLRKLHNVFSITSESGEPVLVTIRPVRRVELKNALHFFNVLFNKIMEILKFVEIKRNHYDPLAPMMVPQHKLEIWPGYVSRVHETDGGLMLICDTSFKVLRNEFAYDIIREVTKRGGGNLKNTLEKVLVGQIVMTEYNKAQTYRVDEIDMETTPQSSFINYRGESQTYINYYKNKWNIDIKDHEQPMIVFRERRKKQEEFNEERLVYLVPELCRMTGLTDAMRANYGVMKDVALFTKVSPDQRQQALKKFLKKVNDNPEASQILNDWGLALDTEPIRMKGRILDPEKLVMGKGSKFTVNLKADWGRDSTNNSSLVSVPLKTWHIVCADRNTAVVKGFIELVRKLAPKMGMDVTQPTLSIIQSDKTDLYLRDLKEKINGSTQIVVCIVPLQREDRYGALKKFCNVDCPIPSQVIVAKTISDERKVTSVVQKILLQINCKLGGELWGCSIPLKNLMCIGIDVYHDPSRQRPSVVGAVGSMNCTMSKWYSDCRLQETKGQELIDVLTICLGKLVQKYRELNKCFPDQIVLFRDGVGDGQIDTVALHEAVQIERFFTTMKFNPEFIFIIVQKRINERFFDLNGSGKYQNPPPGSVIDHTIMRVQYYDFLLVSQHVSQGTVTPTHYVVIKDTSKFSPDIVQKISYKLTHMYFNWPGTIRVPAPCQYAHKLAYQIGEHVKMEPSMLLMERLFYL
ncbi:protein argonaute-3 isoform X2 [Eurytemora carolleeae]|uniref:protein argonaute-3 isoform X2 n=1 Tax=Eurytemora carolleeae TaxID=1294199 RepID=UPI000C7884C5|nr:protein argonaute-3 isoform X2 [Eurytemora carolleeae]|eukprot:XP_023340346.1 protein argonaute-3-like isoform X2 [Eurytemora affinis]